MTLVPAIVAAGFLLFLWGVGRRLLWRWPLTDETWLERALLQWGAGFLACGLLCFLLATLGLYRPVVLQALFGIGFLIVLVFDGKALLAQVAAGLLSLSDSRWTPFERACLPCLALFVLLAAFYALAPTTTWDPLDYHYELPRLWLRHGGFYPITSLVYANFPATMELLFGWLMALGTDLAANQFTIATIAWMGLAAAAIAIRYCSRAAAIGGLTIAFALPLIFTEQAQGGVIDCALAALMLLALWCAARFFETGASRYLWMAALYGGGACAVKHSGWMVLFFLIGVVVWAGKRLPTRRVGALEWASLLFGAGVVLAAPWYLKSLMDTGNPVWPFGESLLNGKPKDFADILYWSNPNFTREATDLLTWWWQVTTDTALTQYRFRLLTPTYLGLAPVLLPLALRPGPHRMFLAFAAFQCCALLFQAPGEPRYMLTSWLLLGMLLVYGAELQGWLAERVTGALVLLAILAPMGVTLGVLQAESRARLPYVLGQESRWESYARRVETAPAIAYLHDHLAPNEVVVHGDPRVFLFEDWVDYRVLYPFRTLDSANWDGTPQRVLHHWHEQRVKYVTLSAAAHYMGLTRATLLEATTELSALTRDQMLGVRSSFLDGGPAELCRGQAGAWQHCEPLPESPVGPLTPRTIELGAFTTREITRLGNTRVDLVPAGEPNYTFDLWALRQRQNDDDVRIVLALNTLIQAGYLKQVLDYPPCPVWEVAYPESWGPPGTVLEGRRP